MTHKPDLIGIIKKKLGIRSPSLEAAGYYDCERCRFHEDCICVVCEEGNTVICTIMHKHVGRHQTCKWFD